MPQAAQSKQLANTILQNVVHVQRRASFGGLHDAAILQHCIQCAYTVQALIPGSFLCKLAVQMPLAPALQRTAQPIHALPVCRNAAWHLTLLTGSAYNTAVPNSLLQTAHR
jgi:hypothetical protein